MVQKLRHGSKKWWMLVSSSRPSLWLPNSRSSAKVLQQSMRMLRSNDCAMASMAAVGRGPEAKQSGIELSKECLFWGEIVRGGCNAMPLLVEPTKSHWTL